MKQLYQRIHLTKPSMPQNADDANGLPYYKPVGRECEVFEHAYKNRLPLLLKGPTGSGKSRFVEYMSAKMKLPMITVSCHDETSAVDLLGRYLVKGSETTWQDGPMTRACRTGAVLYLDEIAEARPDTIVALHSLTDHRRILYLDRHDEEIAAPPTFMLIASFNPGYQKGWKELKASTRQRFVSIEFQYPSEAVESEIVRAESNLDMSQVKLLVQLAGRIRNLAELGLAETVSTRLLVSTAKLMADGLPARLACDVGIVQPLTDDAETGAAVRDVVALVF